MFPSGCGFIWPRKFIQMVHIPGNVCLATKYVERKWKPKFSYPSQLSYNLKNEL